MQLSFQCPHCSQLFDASPEMYGQTCACQNCTGLFFVPAPDQSSDSVGGDLGGGSAATDQGAMSVASERLQLEKQIDELRKGVSLKEEECGRLLAERDTLQILSQDQAAALGRLEVDLWESSRSLHALQEEVEAREKLLEVAEEKIKRSEERIGELSGDLRKLGDLEEECKKAVQRVRQLESDAATTAARIDRDRVESIELQEKFVLIQRERDAFAGKIKELSSSLEQSPNKVVEFQKQAAELTSKCEEAHQAADFQKQDFQKQERARESESSQEQLRDAVTRIKRLEEACSESVRDLESEQANRRQDLQKLASAEKERDAFLEALESLKVRSEQSSKRSNELEILTQELNADIEKFKQAADDQSKRSEADSRANEERLKVLMLRIENLEADRAVSANELKEARGSHFIVTKRLEVAENERGALSRSLEAVHIELGQALKRAGELEKVVQEMSLSLQESNRAVDFHKKRALEDVEAYTERADALALRIAEVEAEHAHAQDKVASIGVRHNETLERLRDAEREKDDLRQENAALHLKLEQSAKHIRDADESANGLRLQVDESLKLVASIKNMEGEVAALQSELVKVSDSEKYWRDQAGVFETKTVLASGQVSRLEGDILEAKNAFEALKLQIECQKEELATMLAATDFVDQRREADFLKVRITELGAQQRVRRESEVDLQRQLAVKGEELELMHHRIIQIEQAGKGGTARGAALSASSVLFWIVLEAPERFIRGLFPSFAGGNGNTFRRVLGVAVWAILTGLLLFAGVRVTDNNFEPAGERGAPGPGNLVETIPVLRDIGSDTVHDSRKEESAPSTDSNEKARTSLATVSVVAGSANAKQSDSKEAPQETAVANSPLPATVQIEMKGMPPVEIAQTADAATQFDSGASSARREPAPIGEGLIEGKETLKNLNRTQLPSQFLGTPFGTATSDVANLVNWTEYGGRLRRKATLVGAPVEAVLISDHERRVMAGAYIRICPRSTESLAPFLEWAVGVQGAIDAEYGEPSSVHEVSEADDAAGVVERIATGKDFYEAMWERQSDEGLIVLSIRAFNERSVVFRLEYLHRAMLAAYTEHQKEEARQKEETQRREETQQKAEGVSQQQESAQDQRSSPARN